MPLTKRRDITHGNTDVLLRRICNLEYWVSSEDKTTSYMLVAPSPNMKEVLKEFHNGASGGHLEVTKMLERLKQCFYQWRTE